MTVRTREYLQSLIRELIKFPTEVEWVEFKCNYTEPQRIAEYTSGLSNAAALCERPKGYLVWGISKESYGGCLRPYHMNFGLQ